MKTFVSDNNLLWDLFLWVPIIITFKKWTEKLSLWHCEKIIEHTHITIFIWLLDVGYSLQNNPKNLHPSFKMDLDFWDCFESKCPIWLLTHIQLILHNYIESIWRWTKPCLVAKFYDKQSSKYEGIKDNLKIFFSYFLMKTYVVTRH